MKIKLLVIIFSTILNCSCAVRNDSSVEQLTYHSDTWRTDKPPSIGEITKAVKEKKVDEKLEGMKDWWLYGPGIGRTMLNVGTTIIFPPYALFLLTNAGLSISGYETIKPIEALPDRTKELANKTYNNIASVPGRFSAYLADREYVEKMLITQIKEKN